MSISMQKTVHGFEQKVEERVGMVEQTVQQTSQGSNIKHNVNNNNIPMQKRVHSCAEKVEELQCLIE